MAYNVEKLAKLGALKELGLKQILGNINSNTNHFDTSGIFISMLFRTTDFFALVTSF